MNYQGPNPYQPQEQPMNNNDFPGFNQNMDPYNINYRQMTVDQWSQIPNSQSVYSQYWSDPSSFEPQRFSQNIKAEITYHDLTFTFIFIANFLITVFLLAFLLYSVSTKDISDFLNKTNNNNASINKNDISNPVVSKDNGKIGNPFDSIRAPLLVSFAICFTLNVLHFAYANLFSLSYIKYGMFIGVVFSFLYCLFPAGSGFFYAFLFPLLSFAFSAIWYCLVKSRIPYSASIFNLTTTIIRRYPSIILVCFLQTLFSFGILLAYSFACLCIEIKGISPFWYVYCVFSYSWITITMSYVNYMTGGGLAATWYFLGNEESMEYYPKYPVFQSFKRAMTTSFGSAACAGFILAVIHAIRAMINLMSNSDNRRNRQDDENGRNEAFERVLFAVLKCIVMCILSILESYARWMSRYALIYCSVYGVPYSEGCRRWAELECTRFVNVIIDGCVIRDGVNYNMIVFIIGSGMISWAIASALFAAKSLAYILTITLSVLLTSSGLLLMNGPMLTISDTLLICFAESPETLRQKDPEIYQVLCRAYSNQLCGKIRR